MLSDLKTSRKVIGLKQTKKALKDGTALRVFMAADAEARVTREIAALCRDCGVEVVEVPTMKELGEACSIDVGAAMAAVIRE